MLVTTLSLNSAPVTHCLLRPRAQTCNLMFHSRALLLLLVAGKVVANLELPNLPLDEPTGGNGEKSDECESCTLLVKSFEKGLEKTDRGKHEGGDTSWEEKNLKNYADSEVRLVEIQDDLCDDLSSGKTQCLSIAEAGEQYIEQWWFEHRNKNIRLHDYLCINKLKKCCPDDAFGSTCQKCPDCDGHGKCDGSGTRSGTGQCNCNQGYTGELCNECDDNYYSSRFGNEGKFECLKCHSACKTSCSGPTSANCTECAAGYARDPKTNLCEDINECELGPGELNLDSTRLCKDGTYCENTDGHYRCSPCHYVCQTCLDYGTNKCLSCASDYHMDENHTCIHFSDQIAEESSVAYYSYLTMEATTFLVINIAATLLTQYLLRRFDLFRDEMAVSILRLSLILPIALISGHINLLSFIRCAATHTHKLIMYLFGGADAADSASLEALNNISDNPEL